MNALRASIGLLALFLTACGGPPQNERERQEQLARSQRVIVALGACAGAVAADSTAARTSSADAAKTTGYITLATCLAAGGVAIFGLPAFAEPELPAEPIARDRLEIEPADPDAGLSPPAPASE